MQLVAQGFSVSVIGASSTTKAMVRANEVYSAVQVIRGDPGNLRFDGSFDLIYSVSDSFSLLRSRDRQISCCRKVCERLSPGGVFVVETRLPDLGQLARRYSLDLTELTEDGVLITASSWDPLRQVRVTQTIRIRSGIVETDYEQARFVWPSELDLMCQLAGLALDSRWASWTREPLVDPSRAFVTVFRYPAPT
jgi:SAM-dependent methyltransferase